MAQQLVPFNAPLSMDVFYDHIYERRPCLIRHGSQRLLDQHLNWNTQQWFQHPEYFVRVVGPQTKVQVEVVPARPVPSSSTTQTTNYTFGPTDSTMKTLTWKAFVAWYMSSTNLTTSHLMYYLTIQGHTVHPPLEQLMDVEDVKLPTLLNNMGEALMWDSAHVWMGRVQDNMGSQSRMHADPYDNLYHLVRGRKKVILIGPNDAEKLYTLGDVIDVAEDGLVQYANKDDPGDRRKRRGERSGPIGGPIQNC